MLVYAASALAGADFRNEQACMDKLREVSTSSLLTESVPVMRNKMIIMDRDDDKPHSELKPEEDVVILTPAPGNREMYLYTENMRFKCQLPGKLGANARYLRLILEDTAFSREYIDLGFSVDRKRKVEVSSKLKSSDLANLVLGILTTLGMGQLAAEVSEGINERTLSDIREVKCRPNLNQDEAKSALRAAIVDRVDGLESFFASKVAAMDKSLKTLCTHADCVANPGLADRIERSHWQATEDLHDNIMDAVTACRPALEDDRNFKRRLDLVALHFTKAFLPSLSAEGGTPRAY